MGREDAPSKVCETCGRTFSWRKKWERSWDQVRYCSDQCRREKPGTLDAKLERAMLELLEARGRGASICPSEAARAVRAEDWQPLMERTRRAARRLVRQGLVDITQGGAVVDPDAFRGPIRVRYKR